MTNQPFRWAFIGAGTLAKQVAKEITASGNHKIVCVYTRNPEKCAAFAAEYGALAAKSAEQAISAPEVEGVYITSSSAHFVEFMHADATKSGAVGWLSERLGIAQNEIAAAGNADNDRDMLLHAGLGVAVSNATPACLDAADWIVGSCDEDGVSELIERLIGERGAK